MRIALFLLLAWLAVAQQPPARPAPLFSFAVLADVQYGDQPTAGKREYRNSLAKLRHSVVALNARGNLAFAIQLGDLIDSKADDLDPILSLYNRLETPRRHVLGNHDFSMQREPLVSRLGMPGAYYDFAVAGWRFVVVDGMDISVSPGSRPAGSAAHSLAQEMLEALRLKRTANAVNWNGAVGEQQFAWLRSVLNRASQANERVILFCHFPVLRESSTPAHLLWNHEKVVGLIQEEPSVAGWFNGHDHQGGYAEHNGVHYVTFPGMVESGDRNSYTVVNVYADRLELEGAGAAPSRTLRIAARR